MLRNKNIIVNRFYVNNARKTARQVLEADQSMVIFYNFHLDTGNACPSPSQCTKRDFIHWADREATPMELDRLQSRQMEDLRYMPQLPNKAVNPLVVAQGVSLFRNDKVKDENYILD